MKKKLLIITPGFPPPYGGVERFAETLAEKLPKSTFDIQVLTGTRGNHSLKTVVVEKKNEYSITRIPTFSIKGLEFPRSLAFYRLIWDCLKNAEIVHLNDVRCFFFSVILGKWLYCYSLVLTTHGFIFHTKRFALIKELYMKLFLFCVRNFDVRVVANGMIDAKFCEAKKLRFRHIDMGIPIEKWTSVQRNPKAGHFLYFGRIDKNKNLNALIQSLSAYAARGNEFELKICGNGDPVQLKDLENHIIACHLEKYIKQLGSVSEIDLLKSMGEAEFVFIPSLFESFGYTFIESLAAGCTVIAQNNEQFRLMLPNDPSVAYLIDMDQQDELTNTIYKARKDYMKFNVKAAKFALRYDENEVVRKYVAQYLYSNALKAR